MSHRVNPAARLRGELRLPGDKSISHRALLFAALAEGETMISGAGDGHDVRSTAGIIRALGATCERLPAAPDDAPGTARWRILSPGRSGLAAQGDGALDCGNSGTSARLGAGLVAGVTGTHVLDGDASLRRRPMTRARTAPGLCESTPADRTPADPTALSGSCLPADAHESKRCGV